jgi:TPR repeat protein
MDTIVCPHDGTELRTVVSGSLAGTVLAGRYELVEEIARGGMGVIYKAVDRLSDEPGSANVAVKLLLNSASGNEALRSRFMVEGRAAGSLNHPNIVRVHDHSFTGEGLPFLVMDWLPGQTLDCLIESQKIDVTLVVELIMQIADALSHAHRHNVIHRDIKPSNIIIIDDYGKPKAVLVDFGIAKIFSQPGKTSMKLTQTGHIFGSPLYMSPEQCMGKKLDSRSDIYALGCVLYECMTGSAPFCSENVLSVIYKHVNEAPVEFANTKSEKALQSIIFKAMEKDAGSRYQAMHELLEALQAYVDASSELKGTASDSLELPLNSSGNKDELSLPVIEDQKLHYYSLAADAGDASAQLELALFYRDGYLVEQNGEIALDWCIKAATQGHIDAMAILADMYRLGEVVELDYDKAFYWFRKAALQDHPYCARMVGHFIDSRMVEEGDFETALGWYKRAATLEDVEAQKLLADYYLQGEKVEFDIEAAMKWITRAANQADSHAQFMLGALLQDVKIFSEPDYEAAFAWLHLAAEGGHPDACRYMSSRYEHGLGVEIDETEALRWMEEASRLRDPQALFSLGMWHKSGSLGLPASSKTANRFLLEAAQLGEPNAQCQYALQLLEGQGVARNQEAAVNWLKKAVRQKHPQAIYHLSLCFRDGIGVKKNETDYLRNLKKSADLKYSDAQCALGLHYLSGGFTKQARKWLNLSAEQENRLAIETLQLLANIE